MAPVRERGRDRVVAIGADGIRGGWAVAACHVAPAAWERALAARTPPPPERRRVSLWRRGDVAAVAALRASGGAVVALDVPLGLPVHGGARPCDAEARRLLGSRASSVFNPPARYLFPALSAPTEAERWHAVQRLIGARRATHPGEAVAGVSRQSVGILDKVADADAFLRSLPGAQHWLVECHPEVSFLRLGGGTPPPPKSTAAGALARLALVEREFPGAREEVRADPAAARMPLADLLDALAALWTALRVACGAVHPERDALGRGTDGRCPCADGLLMRILA